MTLEFSNNAEGGTNGTTVTVANSAGASGDAWSSVTVGAGNTLTFDSAVKAHGALSYKAVIGTTNTCIMQKTVTGTGRYVMEFGFQFSTIPTTGGSRFFEIRNASGAMGALGIMPTTGTVRAYNAAGSNVSASETGGALSVNTMYRIAFAVTPGADTATGTIEYAIYVGDATTPTWSWSSATQNTGTTQAAFIRAGTPTALGSANTFWYDDIRAGSLASGFLGPANVAAPTLNSFSQGGQYVPIQLVATAGGGSLTYSVAQLSGEAGTAVASATAGKWWVPVPSAAQTSWRITAAQPDGQHVEHDYFIDPAASATPPVQVMTWDGTKLV